MESILVLYSHGSADVFLSLIRHLSRWAVDPSRPGASGDVRGPGNGESHAY